MYKFSFFSIVELIECLIFNDFISDFEEKRCLKRLFNLLLYFSGCLKAKSRSSVAVYFLFSESEEVLFLVESVLVSFWADSMYSECKDNLCS